MFGIELIEIVGAELAVTVNTTYFEGKTLLGRNDFIIFTCVFERTWTIWTQSTSCEITRLHGADIYQYYWYKSLADLGGRARRTPPLQDLILSFLHTFLVKSAHVGGPCPP